MKYYVSMTFVKLGDPDKDEPAVEAVEKVLTRPDTYKTTLEGYRRYKRIGMENIHICKHKPARYRKLLKKQRRKTKPVLIEDVVEVMSEGNASGN